MLSGFLQQLFDCGRVVVGRPESDLDLDETDSVSVLLQAEILWRSQLPSGLPPFDSGVAMWAASKLYRAAQLLVYRDLGEEAVLKHLTRNGVSQVTATDHYSADLCLKFLKDVLRLGNALSESDPLDTRLRLLMNDWPLSRVGFGDAVQEESVVWTHPALRMMYLDRVMQRNDSVAKQAEHVAEELRQWEPYSVSTSETLIIG